VHLQYSASAFALFFTTLLDADVGMQGCRDAGGLKSHNRVFQGLLLREISNGDCDVDLDAPYERLTSHSQARVFVDDSIPYH
jgi:hypothetical protein